jgi:hypothetical protein
MFLDFEIICKIVKPYCNDCKFKNLCVNATDTPVQPMLCYEDCQNCHLRAETLLTEYLASSHNGPNSGSGGHAQYS